MQPAKALRLSRLLAQFWSVRGHVREGYDRLEQVLARDDGGPTRDRAAAANAAGRMAEALGHFDRA